MAGYSISPFPKKLGLRAGQTVKLIHAPGDYDSLTGGMMDSLIKCNDERAALDFVHLFTNSRAELEELLPRLKEQLRKNGAIWISWYKKSAKKETELTEDIIRDIALATGLVDVKVCAIDEQWSALKLVYRLCDR